MSALSNSTRGGTAGVVRAAVAAAGAGLAIAVWWALSLRLDPVQLPAPPAVWDALWQGWRGIDALEFVGFQTGGFEDGLLYTTQNVLLGAGLGAVLGVFLGAMVGASRTAAAAFGPPLVVLGATPVLVILPFILIWFGTSSLAQSAIVIMFTFFTVAAVTQLAVTTVGQHYLNFAACLGARRSQLFLTVILPAVTPAVLGAVRVSVALGWSFATVSELIGGQHGTGKIIQAMAQLQRTADVIAAILALAVVAVVVDVVIALGGRWLVRWQE